MVRVQDEVEHVTEFESLMRQLCGHMIVCHVRQSMQGASDLTLSWQAAGLNQPILFEITRRYIRRNISYFD